MKKNFGKVLFLAFVALMAVSFNSDAAKQAVIYAVDHAAPFAIGTLAIAVLFMKPTGQLNTGIDVSALTDAVVKWGGNIIIQKINEFQPQGDFAIAKNVKQPLPLPKISAVGEPRPYREDQDTSGNGVALTDRLLTVYDSKWDFTLDPTKYRNKYIAESGTKFDPNNLAFWQYLVEILAKNYLAAINDKAILEGVRDGAGTGTVDLFDGLIETATNMSLTPIATGTLSSSNAIAKVEQVAEAVPFWMRSDGFDIFCSFASFDKYKKNYRTDNAFGFDMRAVKSIPLDGFNANLEPRSWMKDSQGLVAMPRTDKNMWIGVDGENVQVHATKRMNLIDVRLMMPVGFQIADPEAIVINDQL